MKRFIIKNADGTQQYVMPAVHDTRKKAEETLMGYIHSRNKFTDEYLSLFDFIIEVEKCDEPSKIIPDFEQAKQVIGSDEFVLAKESFCFRDVEINHKYQTSLIAINQLFNIAEAWNKLDGFVPDFSNWSQNKWIPLFSQTASAKRLKLSTTCMFTEVNKSFGPRLCFKTRERAWQFGTQFLDLYNQVFLS